MAVCCVTLLQLALLQVAWAQDPLAPTTPCPVDCTVGLEDWRLGWGDWKKAWCCKHYSIACSEEVVPARMALQASSQYDCTGSDVAWSAEQKEWCCSNDQKGCAVSPATTTPCNFDCDIGLVGWQTGWSEEKKAWCCKHESVGCEGMSKSPAMKVNQGIMTCQLACFGAGAVSVELPGSAGLGDGASLNDVSLEGCRQACSSTTGCEGITFTNQTQGVPFKTMCFGKKQIDTSKCQPGGNYITEVLGALPRGKCAVFGDPHVISFDRVYGPPVTMTDPGEYYLVNSSQLSIHGRFGYTGRFPSASSAVGIAVGGSMVNGHSLVVAYVGPDSGYKGFRVFWDGKRILDSYPSSFTSDDGVLTATHDAMDPQAYHREGRHTIGGIDGLLPSYLFKLVPDLNVYVLIGPDNCNAIIEMRKMFGSQDGYCGNFNCNQDDDALEQLRLRGVAQTIPAGESLFRFGQPAPAWVMTKVASPSLQDCNPSVKAKAAEECKGLPNGEEEACIFDACASNNTEAATEDIGILALPYKCEVGSLASWGDEEKSWCCQHQRRGCADATSASSPEETPADCDTTCTLEGRTATCKARIHWAATHKFLATENPCLLAYTLVLSQCPVCSRCPPAEAGCEKKEPQVVFFKRFDQQAMSQVQQGSRTLVEAGFGTGCLVCAIALIALALAAIKIRSRRASAISEHAQPLQDEVPILE